MKQKNIAKLFLLLVLYSVFVNAKSINWAPIMMGDITTFAPYAKTNTLQTIKDIYRPNEIVNVKVDAALSGDKDWVGVYHKNASSAWKNVVAWNWVSNGITALTETNKIHEMPVGAYEARLFFHNNLQKKASYPFSVAVNNFQTTKATYAPNETVSVIVNAPLSGTKDWVAIFPKDAEINWKNVIAWDWIPKKGTFDLNKTIKPMPAGEYVVKLFFKNTYNVEQTFSFNVSGNHRAFGTKGPFIDKVKSVKTSAGGKVVDAIYYPEGEMNLPVIIYMSGWYSNLESYDGFLKYVASLGFCVIAKQERDKYATPNIYEQELSDQLAVVRDTYHADISKLGIIGHSSGGGTVYYLMNYFKTNHIAGNTKSVLISIDGWFPFGTTRAMLNHFDTPTLQIQFGGFDGINKNGVHPNWDDYAGKPYHHGQDPKINLAIFKLLTHANLEKEYIVLEANNDHLYIKGDYNTIITRQDVLAPIDEFLSHTLVTGAPMNLIDQSNNVITNDVVSEYQYYCHIGGYDFCNLNNLLFK